MKKKLYYILTLFYIAYIVFPLFGDLLGISLGVANIIVTALLVILYPKCFFKKPIAWLFVYYLVLAIYVFFGKDIPTFGIGDYDGIRILIIEMAYILPAISIWTISESLQEQKIYDTIALFSLALLFLSFIYIIPMMVTHDSLLRSTVEGYYTYNIPGIPRYSLVHAYVFLVPCILFRWADTTKQRRRFFIIFFILLSYVIINSYVTTIILLWLFSIILVLVFKSQNKSKAIGWLFFFGIVTILFVVSGLLDSFMTMLEQLFEGTSAHSKFVTFHSMLSGGNIDGSALEEREVLHSRSWQAFTNNILVGSMPVGGHSSILDRLGGLGLIGFLPYLFFIISIVKREKNSIQNGKALPYYYISMIVIGVILYSKGLFGQEGWLFMLVLLPSLLRSRNGRRYDTNTSTL